MDDLAKTVAELKRSETASTPITDQLCDTTERLRKLEDEARKNNLKISGVAETIGENNEQTHQKAQKLIVEKLGLSNVKVVEAFCVGKHPVGRPGLRPIIVKL